LQASLQIWTDRNKRLLLDPLLSVDQKPLHEVAKDDWSQGVSLGAAFHVDTKRRFGLTCDTSCTDVKWQLMWSTIFQDYNDKGPAYELGEDALNNIVRNSIKYEPK
jgi:hypothetical protein